jgi:hypothetical protein
MSNERSRNYEKIITQKQHETLLSILILKFFIFGVRTLVGWNALR